MSKERRQGQGNGAERPLQPFELPEQLAAFLRGKDYACVTQATDQGTVFVVEAPAREIGSLSGRVPMRVSHDLYQHPQAPVIRTVVKIYDQPDRPLAFETFMNVDEPDQWRDFANLAEQDELLLLFYDETLSHRLTKRVRNTAAAQMRNMLNWADRVRAAIPNEEYDFDAAKADVMQRTRL